jgi:hypothetical protein
VLLRPASSLGRASFGDAASSLGARQEPPHDRRTLLHFQLSLYDLILHFWVQLGSAELVARALSVVRTVARRDICVVTDRRQASLAEVGRPD